MEAIIEILKQIFEAIVLSGSLQKFNNLQHFQYFFNSQNSKANLILFNSKTIHSLSINVEQINNAGSPACFNLIIDNEKICYTCNTSLQASTLFDKEITIEVLPNTILTILKQY